MDPFFKRTVVLLCEHNDEGSFGFVINRYLEVDLTEIIEDFPEFDGHVSIGGPVQRDNLFYLHTLGDKIEHSIHVKDGLSMGGDFDIIKSMIIAGKINPDQIRFFVGYSGWDSGQLDKEMEGNSWIVGEAKIPTIMSSEVSDKVWSDTLKDMGKQYEILSNFPEDPSLN